MFGDRGKAEVVEVIGKNVLHWFIAGSCCSLLSNRSNRHYCSSHTWFQKLPEFVLLSVMNNMNFPIVFYLPFAHIMELTIEAICFALRGKVGPGSVGTFTPAALKRFHTMPPKAGYADVDTRTPLMRRNIPSDYSRWCC